MKSRTCPDCGSAAVTTHGKFGMCHNEDCPQFLNERPAQAFPMEIPGHIRRGLKHEVQNAEVEVQGMRR